MNGTSKKKQALRWIRTTDEMNCMNRNKELNASQSKIKQGMK